MPAGATSLRRAAELAEQHLAGLAERRVGAELTYEDALAALDEPLPEAGEDPVAVIEHLVAAAGPATVASPGPRYFGFVTGGALPAALAADWLVSAWDQNAFSAVSSPAAAAGETVATRWLKQILRLPESAGIGLVTGAQMANVTALATARNAVLARAGWDAAGDGLIGAPPVRVFAGEEAHVTIGRALRLIGLGAASATVVPVDGQGRMRAGALAEALARADGPAIVCAQAGNVNTGASDPLAAVVAAA